MLSVSTYISSGYTARPRYAKTPCAFSIAREIFESAARKAYAQKERKVRGAKKEGIDCGAK